jgi:hypothetical protein
MGDVSAGKDPTWTLAAAPFMTAILRSSLGTAPRLAFLRSRAPGSGTQTFISRRTVARSSKRPMVRSTPSQYAFAIRSGSNGAPQTTAYDCYRRSKATHREKNRAAARFLYIRLNMLGTQQSARHVNRESRLNIAGAIRLVSKIPTLGGF